MKKSLYLETTIPSYFTSRPSNDITVLSRQRITAEWWAYALGKYNIYISQVVLREAQEGDVEAAKRRVDIITPFPFLEITDTVVEIYEIYIERLGLPPKALRDAMHLAIASAHGMDFLVTWNCAHIANGEIISKLMKVNIELGISIPVIVTPEELMKE
jgi:predicted nucleic acid-binding protein